MSAEFTPAVERAAELLIREAETTGLITDDVRNGLAAALDVDEMEEVMRAAIDAWATRDIHPGETLVGFLAASLRTAVLGDDS
jgi:hypothetical protein